MTKIILKGVVCFFIGLCFISCENAKSSEANKYFSHQELSNDPKYLLGEKIIFEQIKNPGSLLAKEGKLIVAEKNTGNIDVPIHIIDYNKSEYLNGKGKFGWGPDEITDAFMLNGGNSPKSFWTYSMRNKLFSEFSLEDSLYSPIQQIKQHENFFMAISMVWTKDQTLLCRMVTDNDRFVEFDSEGSRITSYELNHSISKMSVDESLGMIFGITTDENPGVVVFKYELN